MIDRRAFLLSTAAATVAEALERLRGNSTCTGQTGIDALGERRSVRQALSGEKPVPPPDGKVKVACVFSSNVTLIDWARPEAVFDAVVARRIDQTRPPTFRTVHRRASRELRDPGFNAIPDYTYDDAPQAQIIVVPAQAGSPKFYQWLKQASASADLTMSVCIGARHLAQVGLLDGQVATTHHDFIKPYTVEFPKVHWVSGRMLEKPQGRNQRWRDRRRISISPCTWWRRFEAVAVTKVIEYQGTAWMV